MILSQMYHQRRFYYSFFILYLTFVDSLKASGTNLHRNRRQLLFPNQTLIQVNLGVATPTPIKTISVNWAFQANFVLPWNRTQIPIDILEANSGYVGSARRIERVDDNIIEEDEEGNTKNNDKEIERKKREVASYESNASLFHLYKYLEDFLNGNGHNGTDCVLQSLCYVGEQPIHTDDEEDVIHELASFVLNPSNDGDINILPKNHEAIPYIEAYNHGQIKGGCSERYKECSISIIDIITTKTPPII